MKNYICAFLLFLIPSFASAMDKNQFDKLISELQAKNFQPVDEFLKTQKETLKKDPEYYVILLNYDLLKGKESRIVVSNGQKKTGEFGIYDKNNKKVGSLGEEVQLDDQLIREGILQTQSALPAFKSRLDIHFGIVAAAQEIKDWELFGNQLVDILKTSKEIQNQWTWGSINSMEGAPEEFMMQNVLSKTHFLFRLENPKADEALKKVSEALIQYYPKKVYGYSNLGALYLAKKDYPLAKKYLQEASQIDPKDEVVQKNILQAQKLSKQS